MLININILPFPILHQSVSFMNITFSQTCNTLEGLVTQPVFRWVNNSLAQTNRLVVVFLYEYGDTEQYCKMPAIYGHRTYQYTRV